MGKMSSPIGPRASAVNGWAVSWITPPSWPSLGGCGWRTDDGILGPVQKNFVAFLDSPNRIILSVTRTQRIGYDGAKMSRATKAWLDARPADDQV